MKQLLRSIYNNFPFKKEFFSLVKMVHVPGERIYKHLYFKGVFKVRIDNKSSFLIRHYGYQIENELFWAGITNGWEKESMKLWIRLCYKADVVFDIGANTGVYALIAKAVNSKSRVVAFEPVKRVFEKLQANCTLNGYDILCSDKAVSDKDGEAIIFDTDTEHTLSVTVNKNLSMPGTEVFETKISTLTLNTFIRENNFTKIDLIKIDVETHEPEVLLGFSDYFKAFHPTMLIEILNDEIATRVEKIVDGMGYLYFNIDERSGIRQVSKLTASDYYNYLFCDEATAVELGLLPATAQEARKSVGNKN